MNNKCVLCLVLLLGLGCGSVFAGDEYRPNDPCDPNRWVYGHGFYDPCYPIDNNYWNAGNWSMKVVPDDPTFTYPGNTTPTWLTDVYMNSKPDPCDPNNALDICIIDRNTSCYHIMVGCYGGRNELHITGGTLTLGPWGLQAGRGGSDVPGDADSFGRIKMTGGAIKQNPGAGAYLLVPESWRNGTAATITGDFNMSAGTVDIASIGIGERTGVGTVELTGGTINLTGMLLMNWDNGIPGQDDFPSASMDIAGGQILFTTNQVARIKGYIDEPNGWITFYGSHPLDERYYILDYDVTNPGKTTLAGINPASVVTERAWAPNPGNGATVDITNGNITLSWNSGDPVGAYKHDVNFGTTNPPPLIGRQNQGDTDYIAAAGTINKTYYWKINEVDEAPNPDVVYAGTVWSFKTANYLTVDDFNAGDLKTFWTDTGSAVSSLVNNDSTMHISCGSGQSGSVYRTPPASLWNQQGLMALRLSFYGSTTNAANAQLSVTVNNTTTVVYNNANGLLQEEVWSQWYIPYSALTDLGANLNNVTKIAVNVGSGASQLELDIDNIELTLLQCVNPPAGDVNGDCVINLFDFAGFAGEWLVSGLGLI